MIDKTIKGFSIFTKFTLYLFCALLVIILLFIYLFTKQQLIHEQEIVSRLSSEISLSGKAIDDTMKYSELLLKSMSERINEKPQDKQHIFRVLQSFSKIYANKVDDVMSISMFSWADKDELIKINSEFGILNEFKDISYRDYIKKTRVTSGKLFLGKPGIGSISNQYIIPAGMSIKNKSGQIIGTIVFGVNIDGIYKRVLNANLNAQGNFAITYQNKIIKTSYDESIFEPFPKIDFINGKLQVFSNNSIFNNPVMIYSPISDTQYGILISLKNNNKYLNGFKTINLIEFLVTTITFAFLLLLLKRDFINPVLQLSKTAESISSGKPNIKIPKSNIKEINKLAGSILMIHDFVEREQEVKKQLKLAKQTAEKANIARATVLRSITHDIKNYVFGIYGLTRLILDKKESAKIEKDEDLQTIETISDQSKELMHFVEDLLDTSQIESGKFLLGKIELCNLKNLIERMLLLNYGLAMRHRVIIRTEIEDDLPMLKCDVRRIKQILSNLITNAIKYSHSDSEVKISAKHLIQKKQIYIEVLDNGIGLNENEIEMIMSGDGANIDKTELNKEIDSNGIGMNIVLDLLKLHHAEIDIDSTKGRGTKIKLYFNLDFENYSDEENPNKISKSKAKSNKVILLVEDNPVNIKVTSTILKNAGYKTHYAENGKEALKILDEKHFDLILMDGEMPVMNGYDTTAAIRSGESFVNFKNYKKIPIIALMSSSDNETIKRAKDSGMNDHLEKSSSKNKLLSTIEKYLRRNVVKKKI